MGNCNRRRSARRLRRLRTERYFRVRAHRAFPRVCMVLSMRSIFSSPVISGRALSNGPSNPICTRRRGRARRPRASAGEATFSALFYPDLSGRDEAKPPRGRRPGARPPDPPPWPKRPTAPPRRIGTANGRTRRATVGPTMRDKKLPSSTATSTQILEAGDLRHLDVRVKGAEAEHEVVEAARVPLPGCVAHGLSTALVL